MLAFTARLVALRRSSPTLGRHSFFSGRAGAEGVKDVAWFGASGEEHTDAHWFDSAQTTLGMYLDGEGIPDRDARGERLVGDSLLVVLHLGAERESIVLPGPPWATAYDVLLDTADEAPADEHRQPRARLAAGAALELEGRSVVVLRAER